MLDRQAQAVLDSIYPSGKRLNFDDPSDRAILRRKLEPLLDAYNYPDRDAVARLATDLKMDEHAVYYSIKKLRMRSLEPVSRKAALTQLVEAASR